MDEATAIEVIEMTPHQAIQQAIWELLERRAEWKTRDDPNGVREWIDIRIGCLTQAQKELEELREIKKALGVLRYALI